MVISWMGDIGGQEGKLITEVFEDCISFVIMSEFDGSICISSDKYSSCRMLFEEIINSSFKDC